MGGVQNWTTLNFKCCKLYMLSANLTPTACSRIKANFVKNRGIGTPQMPPKFKVIARKLSFYLMKNISVQN